jgi:small subunit ribosomal protein S5
MAVDQVTKSDGLQEKLITARRHAKVTKGGRLFSFATCVVVGDGKGHIGFGKASAREVSLAMPKALEKARRNMLYVELKNDTVLHRVEARYGATKVIILPAKSTGIIAGGPMRAMFEVIGIKHGVAKIIGSRNPINVIHATLAALKEIKSLEAIKEKRHK